MLLCKQLFVETRLFFNNIEDYNDNLSTNIPTNDFCLAFISCPILLYVLCLTKPKELLPLYICAELSTSRSSDWIILCSNIRRWGFQDSSSVIDSNISGTGSHIIVYVIFLFASVHVKQFVTFVWKQKHDHFLLAVPSDLTLGQIEG